MTEIVLPEIPIIDGVLVEAPFEHVRSYFRGFAAHTRQLETMPYYEVTGDAAGIQHPLGPDSYQLPNAPWLEKKFAIRGRFRVSIIACNPKYCWIESFNNQTWPYTDQIIKDWTQKRAIHLYSRIGPNPLLDAPGHVAFPYSYPSHGLSGYAPDGSHRFVASEKSKGWNFYDKGEPYEFEDPSHYRKRLKSDRMSRTILFSYLDNLEIDPTRTFRDRALTNPHLYTADHVGQDAKVFESDRLRFLDN